MTKIWVKVSSFVTNNKENLFLSYIYMFAVFFFSYFWPHIPNLSLIHWETMKFQWNYWLQTFLAVATKRNSEMTSYLDNDYNIINYFPKFEKFLPHRITIPSFMIVGSQMPEIGWLPPPPPRYKLRNQNIPYKPVLTLKALGVGVFHLPVRFSADNCWSKELCYWKFCSFTQY